MSTGLVTTGMRTHQSNRDSATVESKGAVIQLTSVRDVEDLLEACKSERKKCIINVSTTSCGPCKLLLPTLEKYAEEHGGETATFAKFFSDDNEELRKVASSWKVFQVPTYRMYNEAGELHKQFTTGDPKKLGSSLYLFLT